MDLSREMIFIMMKCNCKINYEHLQSQQREAERQVEGLFQSLLALSFTEGLAESFGFKAQRTLQS